MKRVLSLILCFALVLSVFVFSSAVASADSAVSCGDVDGNGSVDALDAVYLAKHLAGCSGYSSVKKTASDTDGSGETDMLDLAILERHLASFVGYRILPVTANPEISLFVGGDESVYRMAVGEALPKLQDVSYPEEYTVYPFMGWYGKDLTTKYTNVTAGVTEYYAVFDGYSEYSFQSGGIYDYEGRYSGEIKMTGIAPWRIEADPTDANNSVLKATLKSNGNNTHVAIPSVCSADNKPFTVENASYIVSFRYRLDGETGFPGVSVQIRQSIEENIGATGGKSGSKFSLTANKDGEWHEVTTTIDCSEDYNEYPCLIFCAKAASISGVQTNLYIDDVVIRKVDKSVIDYKLVICGETKTVKNKPGYAIPEATKFGFMNFLGWYDSTFTTKYEKFTEGVDTYYAKYDSTFYTFGGEMFDPNNKYKGSIVPGGVASWRIVTDPKDSTNRVLKVSLEKTSSNTHVPFAIYDGVVTEGFTMKKDKIYLLDFKYRFDEASDEGAGQSITFRGSAKANIGNVGGKTDSLSSTSLTYSTEWIQGAALIKTDSAVEDYPYLIMLAQGTSTKTAYIYFDDLVITEYDKDTDITIKTKAYNLTFVEPDNTYTVNDLYVGAPMPEPKTFGGSSVKWIGEDGITPYTTVPGANRTFTLKADDNVTLFDFKSGGLYDPNGAVAKENRLTLATDPTDSTNKVFKVRLAGSVGNHNAALCNGKDDLTNGFKLKTGCKYTISFKYYGTDLNDKGVSIQFRGSKASGIGQSGNKTNSFGGFKVAKASENSWKTATVTFTYTYSDTDYPYLLFLAQDGSESSGSAACTATLYIDNLIIKEDMPKTYTTKTGVKINGYSLNYSSANRKQYIVVPTTADSYLATMQIENLVDILTNVHGANVATKSYKYGSTTFTRPYLHEDEDTYDHTANSYHQVLYIGDVAGNPVKSSSLTKDQFTIRFISGGTVAINGGSTYALAMGISEYAKMLETCANDYNFTGADNVAGSYSEKAPGYSSKTYYKPVLLEDFDEAQIDTSLWNIYTDSGGYTSNSTGWYDHTTDEKKYKNVNARAYRLAENTYLENGNLVIKATYKSEFASGVNTISYYGGMLRSHGKMKFKFGYLETSCLQPYGGGLWTSLWTSTPSGSGEGLFTNEMDINETYGVSTAASISPDMHLWPTSAGSLMNKDHLHGMRSKYDGSSSLKVLQSGKNLHDAFHTHGMLWTEEKCVFTFDGDVHYVYYLDTDDKRDAFYDYTSLIISMAVGFSNNGSSNPVVPHYENGTKVTPSSSQMAYWKDSNKYLVDYIHIYQIDGQSIIRD